MTSIANTLNAGSGIDTAALVTNLVAASFDPKDAALKAKETANTAQISSVGTLANKMATFSGALTTLIKGGTLQTQPSSSNSAILTATAQPGARIGNLSSQIDVRQLAKAQSLVSATVANANVAVGTGTLTLQMGGVSKTVTIDSTNNSLAGLARAINAAGLGVTANGTTTNVTASVVTDANGSRLAIKGPTGAASAFTITPGAGADASLAAYAFGNGQTGGMTQAQAAQDAVVRMDGVDISRATNSIGDLIDGVTLNLVSAQPGTSVALGAVRPAEAITQAVNDFVGAYNELKGAIDAAVAAPAPGAAVDSGGPLNGNSAIRQMQQQLSRLTSTKLASGGSFSTLAEIGVRTKTDGTLEVNDGQLSAALAKDPDAVEAMFNPTQRASDPSIKITSALKDTKPGTYQLTNIVAQNGSINASGTIAGVAALTTGSKLFAASKSAASGLVIEPQANVASATVTVDLGLGGALQAISDALTATNTGVLSKLSAQLTTTQKSLASDRTKLTDDSAAYKTQLTSQFTTMDARVSAFKATQSYLTQQIAMWTKSN